MPPSQAPPDRLPTEFWYHFPFRKHGNTSTSSKLNLYCSPGTPWGLNSVFAYMTSLCSTFDITVNTQPAFAGTSGVFPHLPTCYFLPQAISRMPSTRHSSPLVNTTPDPNLFMVHAAPLGNDSSGVSVFFPGPSSMSEAFSFRTELSTTTLVGGGLGPEHQGSASL